MTGMVLRRVIADSVAGMVLRVYYSWQYGRSGSQGTALKNKAQRLLPSAVAGTCRQPAVCTVNLHLTAVFAQAALLPSLHQSFPFKA